MPVTAAEVRAGDILLIGGLQARVDAVEPVQFVDEASGEMVGGLAIWWTAPNSRGILRRRVDDVLYRVGEDR